MKKHILQYKFETLTGDVIEYKPFTRKDFKFLSTAATISQGDTLYESIGAFIQSCILSDHKVETMPFWDSAMLFIKARSVSVSEVVELSYNCTNVIKSDNDSKVCGSKILAGLILPNTFYINGTNITDEINLTDNIVLKMRFPNIVEYLKTTYEAGTEAFDNDDVVSEMIVGIYDNEDYDSPENNELFKSEIKEMLSQLPPNLYQKIMIWFKSLPNVGCDIPIKCTSCGHADTDKLRGLIDFFV